MHTHHRTERGSILPFVALAMVLAGVSIVLLARVGGAATARAGARNAADAAALAGAAEGRDAAVALAEANGAELLSYQDIGMDTLVRVRLGPAEATGRARRSGDRGGAGGSGSGSAKGLAPAMRAALARAEQLLGRPVPITSGFRSTEKQAALYANRAANPYPVAAPGSSMHEKGLAIDVPADFVPTLLAVASRAGLCHPYPVDDPIHFEVCQGGG
ncbi:MAG TPA: M15 family metallopeptidase [Acidimicrobiales bacterium]|nr:M15 family metallopeptidase [Acidimicrobiales bacterium]